MIDARSAHEQDRRALADALTTSEDPVGDTRRQPERRLIEHEESRQTIRPGRWRVSAALSRQRACC
jgi:hypothetical protein